jgi:hypothetical protein
VLTILYRYWFLRLRCCPSRDFLLQTPNDLCLCSLPDSHILYLGRSHGDFDTSIWCCRTILQSRTVQHEGACFDHLDGFSSIPVRSGYRGLGSPRLVLWQVSKQGDRGFIVITSQLIGYGLAGLLREVLVYPTHILWPMNLPVTSLLESLHKDRVETKARLKIFYIIFGIMFVWELFPEASIYMGMLEG